MSLSKIRTAARMLLTMDEKDPKRIFEGEALLRRMYRYGLLVRGVARLLCCTLGAPRGPRPAGRLYAALRVRASLRGRRVGLPRERNAFPRRL